MTASPLVHQSTVSQVSPADRADFDGFYAANVGQITAQIRAHVGDLAEPGAHIVRGGLAERGAE